MGINLKEVENLKIVPKNYESGAICEISEINAKEINLSLKTISNNELQDYKKTEDVEIFGLDKHGIVYFKTAVTSVSNSIISVKYPENIKVIQRRKYSRVPFCGKLTVEDKSDITVSTEDISAGGVRFCSNTPFMVGDEFKIKVELESGLVVNCTMQPIRVEETGDAETLQYSISAKFKKIRSIDRIALMQYSLRFISEMENKS